MHVWSSHNLFHKHVGERELRSEKKLIITIEMSMAWRRSPWVVVGGMDGVGEIETKGMIALMV
jgi:hypothetical protein